MTETSLSDEDRPVVSTDDPTMTWRPRGRDFVADDHRDDLLAIFSAVRGVTHWDNDSLTRILAQHPRDSKGYFSKIELITGYRQLTAAGLVPWDRVTMGRLQMKPVRTSSGVAPVTVLTEPAGCPGECIFCPTAAGMPKSYLPNEPGARRAAECGFDPHLQVSTRIETFTLMGHSADKVELLVLGGTWSAYPKPYREWFIHRCLDALNGEDSATLAEAQRRNECARHRNVGLVIETRPDWVTPGEVRHLRQLGVTKVQLGIQSLDDRLLYLNGRGHSVETSRLAARTLRLAGFKLHLHWMPNLLGATPEGDRADFARLWSDPALRPDELKIYPCSIIEGTELYRRWRMGDYQPYSDDALISLVADCKATIPGYCRVNRVFRDIPADDIVAGSKRSNLRQLVQQRLAAEGRACGCIRCREVRGAPVSTDDLRISPLTYDTVDTRELFLAAESVTGQLAGFLRLSLPRSSALASEVFSELPEIRGAAMIRELHVYGPALAIGKTSLGEAQHLGVGRGLVAEAMRISREAGFARLAVIAALGTRGYYRKLGFERGELYMMADL